MPNPVIHWEIAARDAEKMQRFYGDLFGWKIQPMTDAPHYATVTTGASEGINGGIMQAQIDPSSGQAFSYTAFYVQVDDLDTSLARAEELGAKIMLRAKEVPNVGTIAFLQDPEGRVVGLFKK